MREQDKERSKIYDAPSGLGYLVSFPLEKKGKGDPNPLRKGTPSGQCVIQSEQAKEPEVRTI